MNDSRKSGLLGGWGAGLLILLAACQNEQPLEVKGTPVKMETAVRGEFAPSLPLLGVVRAAQSVPLTARQRGVVTYPARFDGGLRTGERVTRGETIAVIRNDDVVSLRTQAKLQMDAAAAEFERKKRSHEAGIVSAADFSSAQVSAALAREIYANASRDVETLRVTAPADGTLVVARPYAPGTIVEPANVLADLVSGSAL